MNEERRVVITGLGAVTSLGSTWQETWKRVLAGDSGAGPITQFNAETWPTTFACEVKNFCLPDGAVLPQHRAFLNRPTEFGMAAAKQAIEESGIQGHVAPERFGVAIGAGIGAISPHTLSEMLRDLKLEEGLRDLWREVEKTASTQIVLKNHPGVLGAVLASKWQALGPVTTIHTACASSGQSLGQAFLQIKRNEADAMIAGGADSLAGELLLAGFCLLGALSRRNENPSQASRPFDKDRDGFVAGEGAAILILEERQMALRRGAKIYGEIVGYGETESAYRITDLPPNGRGIVEAMHMAVAQSGLDYSEIGYINAHGTSTELNDRVEALAIRRVFGSRGVRPMISSTKSEVGHLISAAGALEMLFSTLATYEGRIPPTRSLEASDCGDDLDFVCGKMREVNIRAALSNSIGFGGSNSSIIVARHA